MAEHFELNRMINCPSCLDNDVFCEIHKFDPDLLMDLSHEIIEQSLKDLPVRKKHTETVAKRMKELYNGHSIFMETYCYAVGLSHDVGYGHVETGHHAIDGALYLQTTELSDLAPYVAWHSTAKYEAEARGLSIDFEAPFSKEINDQLWYADFTTSPHGELVTVSERLNEIRQRYSPDSQVIEALNNSEEEMREAFKHFD